MPSAARIRDTILLSPRSHPLTRMRQEYKNFNMYTPRRSHFLTIVAAVCMAFVMGFVMLAALPAVHKATVNAVRLPKRNSLTDPVQGAPQGAKLGRMRLQSLPLCHCLSVQYPFNCHLETWQRGGGGQGGLAFAMFHNLPQFSAIFRNFWAIAFCLSTSRACWCPLSLRITVAEQ